jgi:hypothetical protein
LQPTLTSITQIKLATMPCSAISNYFDVYKMQSFELICIDLQVFPTDNAESIMLQNQHIGNVAVGFRTYTFSLASGSEFEAGALGTTCKTQVYKHSQHKNSLSAVLLELS